MTKLYIVYRRTQGWRCQSFRITGFQLSQDLKKIRALPLKKRNLYIQGVPKKRTYSTINSGTKGIFFGTPCTYIYLSKTKVAVFVNLTLF